MIFGLKHNVNVAAWKQIGLQSLQDTLMTSHKQYGDMLRLSSVGFFTLKCMAIVLAMEEVFPSVKLQNGYADY